MIRLLWAAVWFVLGMLTTLTTLLMLGLIHPTTGIGSPGFLSN